MCLIDLIGLRDCGATEPTSGKYVNSLPAISTELVQGISDTEQASFAGLWNDIQLIAQERFASDFQAGLSSVADFKGNIYKTQNLRINRTGIDLPLGLASYKGLQIDLPSNKGVKVDIKRLEFLSNTALAGVNVVAIELLDGSSYQSTTADVTVGKNSILLDWTIQPKYENSRIFIGIDAEGLELKQDKSSAFIFDFADCEDCGNTNNSLDYFLVRPTWVDKATLDSAQKSSGSGVAVVATVYCSIAEIICDNLSELSEAYRYLLGYLLLEQKQQSRNANIFTYFNPEATDALKMAFAEQYERELLQAVERIDIREYCFSCNDYGNISTGYLMP